MSGYIDLQVNGYAGVDFNSLELELDDFSEACDRIFRDGTDQFLPTLITAPWEQLLAKVDRIAKWLDQGAISTARVSGLHVEGPFLSPVEGFIGAHPKASAIPATIERAAELVDRGRGWVRLVTLAPEVDPDLSLIHI